MAEIIATACAGIFAGAAIFVSAVQHPASLQVGATPAAKLFSPMYSRAAPMQASLALVGTLSGLRAWYSLSRTFWLVGAALLGSVIPFTLIRMKTVNDRLLDPDLDPAASDIPELLQEWGHLHWVRSVTSALAFLVFLNA